MKNIKTLLSIISLTFLSVFAFGQTEGFNYQAIAMDGSGQPLTNSQIGIEISIIEGLASNTPMYTESHLATTNNSGLFTVIIGLGDSVLADFHQIDFSTGNSFFVQIGVDINGGTSYIDLGTTQLLYVPFAKYAEKAGSADLIGTDLEDNQWELVIDEDGIVHAFSPTGVVANEFIRRHMSSMTTDVGDFVNSDGFQLIVDFIDVLQGDSIMGHASLPNLDSLVFDSLKGVFDYQASTDQFTFVPGGSTVIINFPYQGAATNNARLELTDFQTIEIDSTNVPTSIVGNMSLDGVNYGNIDVAITYSNMSTNIIPTSITSTGGFLTPYDISGNLSSTNNVLNGQFSLTEGSDTVFTAIVSSTFENDSLNGAPDSIVAEIDYQDMRIEVSVNIAGLESANITQLDPSPFNDNVNIELFDKTTNQRVGKVIMVASFTDNFPLYIEFEDGTTKSLEYYMGSLLTDLMVIYQENKALFQNLGIE